VAAHGVYARANDLAITLLEFRLQASHLTQFRGAPGGKVLGMREQDSQRLPIHSWKLVVPCELSAVKFGASSNLNLGYPSNCLTPTKNRINIPPSVFACSGAIRWNAAATITNEPLGLQPFCIR
jgi:hypothetical protein